MQQNENSGITRRNFLKFGFLAAGGVVLAELPPETEQSLYHTIELENANIVLAYENHNVGTDTNSVPDTFDVLILEGVQRMTDVDQFEAVDNPNGKTQVTFDLVNVPNELRQKMNPQSLFIADFAVTDPDHFAVFLTSLGEQFQQS